MIFLLYQQVKKYLGGKLFVETRGTGVGQLEVTDIFFSVIVLGLVKSPSKIVVFFSFSRREKTLKLTPK